MSPTKRQRSPSPQPTDSFSKKMTTAKIDETLNRKVAGLALYSQRLRASVDITERERTRQMRFERMRLVREKLRGDMIRSLRQGLDLKGLIGEVRKEAKERREGRVKMVKRRLW